MSELSRTSAGDPAPGEQTEAPALLHRDDLFHLLQNSRRRATLRYLFDHDGEAPVVLGDLAKAVAARECDTTVQRLTSEERQRVYIALYQSHLPKLEEYGAVDYDRDRGTVELREFASVLRPYLGDEFDDPAAEVVSTETRPESSPEQEPTMLGKLTARFR